MLRVLSIIGTRPEAIKMAPIIRVLNQYPDQIESKVCISGQHRDLLKQVLDVFDIEGDFDLELMEHDQTLENLTSRALVKISEILRITHPDIVLVQGDTTTVLAGSLAAFYQKIPVGHVEAGLRTGDIYQPFPEEVNRKLTDSLSGFHFTPTTTGRDALLREGVSEESIYVTGNTVIDALYWAVKQKAPASITSLFQEISENKLILVTAHRRENFGKPFENICHAIRIILEHHPDCAVIFPVHPNPSVMNAAAKHLKNVDRLNLIAPQPYLEFVHLMNAADIILTDSGGIQEEAPALGKPVLVLREVTERPEAVQSGGVKVIGTCRDRIISEVDKLLRDTDSYRKMAQVNSPYGDGKAAERIVNILLKQCYP